MSYALDVEPDARAAFGALDVEAQEEILDLLDSLAAEGPRLTPVYQRHLLRVRATTASTYVLLKLSVIHSRRTLRLTSLQAVVV